MKPNPFLYAIGAALYIVLIVTVMSTFTSGGEKDTIIIPMAMLSLFVLSAAIMGFLFVYEPFCLYHDGKRREALAFFSKTVGTFAIFVVVYLGVLMYIY